jgi:hypothetical protein
VKTAVCVAAGPSIRQADIDVCRDLPDVTVGVVNRMYDFAPWAHLLYGCDFAFWQVHYTAIRRKFAGSLWTQDADAARQFPGLNYVHAVNGADLKPAGGISCGIIDEPGGNSGFQLLSLFVRAGAKRIVLLGYDMGATGTGHAHDDHPLFMGNPTQHQFAKWVKGFNAAAEQAQHLGIEIINCSRETALTCFRRSTIGECLQCV